MKKHFLMIFVVLMTIVSASIATAQTPIITPSGQLIYYYWVHEESEDYAVIVPPGTVSYYIPIVTPPEQTAFENPWEGYAKPGGELIIPDTITVTDNPYYPDSSINVPVKQISREAFYHCTNITSVIIPNTVERIEQWAFCGCRNLRTVTIGTNLDYIGTYTFLYCDSIDTVYYNATNATYANERYIMSEATSGLGNVFYVSDSAALIIGDNVVSIPNQMFVNCTFHDVIIGSSVASIGENNHFREINSLGGTTIFKGQTPPILGNGVRFGSNMSTCVVPCGCSNGYYLQWSNLFASYTEEPASVELSVSSNNSMWGTVQIEQDVNCSGEAIIRAIPNYGYRFNHWGDDNSDNPRSLSVIADTFIVAYFDRPDSIFVYDTTIVHDTTYIDVPFPVHDTTYIDILVHDTTIVHDTAYVDVPYPVHDTMVVMVTDTITNTVYDTIINTIHDTTTVYLTDTLWMTQYDTIYIHDTVFVTQEGIGDVEEVNAKIYQRDGMIVVESDGEMQVQVFDAMGRVVEAHPATTWHPSRGEGTGYAVTIAVPASGVYLVRIGDLPARKIVVVR